MATITPQELQTKVGEHLGTSVTYADGATRPKSTDGPKVGGVKMGVNYGCNKVRFLSPVRSGKRVRSHIKLLELEEKRPGQWQQTNEVTVEIEGEEKPALIAEWISQFFV